MDRSSHIRLTSSVKSTQLRWSWINTITSRLCCPPSLSNYFFTVPFPPLLSSLPNSALLCPSPFPSFISYPRPALINQTLPTDTGGVGANNIMLYSPSGWSETAVYIVFTFVRLSLSVYLCVCTHSVQSSTVCVPPTMHQPSPSCNPSPSPNPWRICALPECLLGSH